MTTKAIAFGTSLALLAGVATAKPRNGEDREGKKGGKAIFEKMDTDGDGVISKAEFLTAAEARFAKADTDGDGAISAEEAKELRPKKRGKRGERRGKRGRKNAE